MMPPAGDPKVPPWRVTITSGEDVPRTAREVIDAAITENRAWEYLCLALTVAFPVVGVGVLCYGAWQGDGLIALSGSVTSGLFWPALRYATAFRRANMTIRMLEVPLGKAETAKEAADAIREAYERSSQGRG